MDAVPGSSRRDPSAVAFNNGMLRAMRCGEGAHPRIWQHAICVLPLVEGRTKRGGAALCTFPTDPFGKYEAAEGSSDQKMEPLEAAAVSGDPSVGVVVALGDEGACDNAAGDIEDVEWASDHDAGAWVGSVNSRSDDPDCAEEDSSVNHQWVGAEGQARSVRERRCSSRPFLRFGVRTGPTGFEPQEWPGRNSLFGFLGAVIGGTPATGSVGAIPLSACDDQFGFTRQRRWGDLSFFTAVPSNFVLALQLTYP